MMRGYRLIIGLLGVTAAMMLWFWRGYSSGELRQYSAGQQTGAAEYFANAGGDVNATNNQHETPLLIASCYGNVELVSFLLAHGAHVEARDDDGDTPLISAVRESILRNHRRGDFPTTVGLLLAYHAQVDARNKNGETALSLAQAQGNKAMVAQLQRAQEP